MIEKIQPLKVAELKFNVVEEVKEIALAPSSSSSSSYSSCGIHQWLALGECRAVEWNDVVKCE